MFLTSGAIKWKLHVDSFTLNTITFVTGANAACRVSVADGAVRFVLVVISNVAAEKGNGPERNCQSFLTLYL